MPEIVMPRLSDTMEEGTILRWIKHNGEHVARGEELVEIETDKAAMVYESDEEGVLEITAQEGETLPVGATIAHIGTPTGGAATPGASGAATPGASGAATPSAGGADDGQPSSEPTAAARAQPETAPPTLPEPSPQPGADESSAPTRTKASPVARRIARERDVDLHEVAGSGPGGRIVRADVEAAAVSSSAAAQTTAASAAAQATAGSAPQTTAGSAPGQTAAGGAVQTTGADAASSAAAGSAAAGSAAPLAERVATAKGETTVVELTRTQQTIARRMAESKATIPDFSVIAEIDMEACVALRAELKRLSPEEVPTYNDMVVKACALALREHGRVNGSYRDGKLQLHSRVNVGIAVATDDALVVPTVFDTDRKALGEIARETRTLAERVRSGAITPPELGGGTFTVSNLGMYGVRSFTAIVNPPQAAILSIGSLEPRAVVRDGEVAARHTLSATLVCDHRILYGADAARFLARVRKLLEEPAALVL